MKKKRREEPTMLQAFMIFTVLVGILVGLLLASTYLVDYLRERRAWQPPASSGSSSLTDELFLEYPEYRLPWPQYPPGGLKEPESPSDYGGKKLTLHL